jgi:phosphoglycerol transferase
MVSLHPALPRFIGYWSGFSAIGLAGWISRTFGEPSIDQILYHLHYSDGAAIQMGEIFLMTFLAEVLLFPLAFALVVAFVHGQLTVHVAGWRRHLVGTAPSLAIAAGSAMLLLQFSVFSYAAAHFEPDHFAEQYVDAQKVPHEAGHRRNLILIYAESLEETYGDRAIFGRDLLESLHSLGAQRFGDYGPAPGTNWTIAGMVATQCGVPLKVYSEYDIKRREGERVFLPRATCLGDLLQARGYRNVFMGGAPLSFAGKGSFLRDHGYAEVYGREEWQRAGIRPGELNEWGLYDSALLERARARLEVLHASGQPFNLTLLTLNMHNPHGFMSNRCRSRGARDFEGIVGCTSDQLAEFVRFVQARGYLKDTTVVILGDHLAMPNSVYDKLQQAGERKIFNLVLAEPPLPLPLDKQALLPFDFFPTLVELVGFPVAGHRLGLGYSALGDATVKPVQRPAQALPTLNGSAVYRHLWEPMMDAQAKPGAGLADSLVSGADPLDQRAR